MTARPWRAAAYMPGPPRTYLRHTSAATRAGLDAFESRWRDMGCTVDVWEVLPLRAVEAAILAAPDEPRG